MSISKPQSSQEPAPSSGGASRSTQRSRPGLFKRTPRDFLDMFLERWWLGAIAGGIAAALIIIFRPHFEPLFRTEAQLLFETQKAAVIPVQGVINNTLQNVGELNTHMETLRSTTFVNTVLNSFTPEETKIIQAPYVDKAHPEALPPSPAEIIWPGVAIGVKKGTPILVISVTNRSPEAAALIANRYAQKYIDYKADNASTVTTTAIQYLQNSKEDLLGELNLAQSALQTFRNEKNLATLGESRNIITQKLNQLTDQKLKAEDAQVEAKSLIDKIEAYRAANRSLLELPQIKNSESVAAFDHNLSELRSQKILWSEEYGAELPKMKQLDLQIAETQRRLDQEIEKLIAERRELYAQSVETLKRITTDRTEAEAEQRKLDNISNDYKILETVAADTAARYSAVAARLNDVRMTTRLQDTNIQIFDPALMPGAPADRGIAAVSMKAASAGLGLLFFIPLAIGLFDTRIRTPVHIEEGLQEPLLGAVKRMKKMGETQRAQVFRLQKEKDLAEAYLGIFSEIEVRSALGFPKTLMITSSVPAEGKSLLCSNLAAVFASHKRRTLLVDCDLRRPTLHRYFGVKVDTGWVQWLETPAASRPSTPLGIVAVSEELHLLPAGRAPGNPTELLDRLSRRETLQPLLQNYDIVIFDTPPAAVFPDALLLARSCHEMIYVCRYRTVRLSVVRKVLDRFRDSGVSTLGVVLNQLPETKARNYGYHGYGMQSADYYKAYAEKPEA